jgi:hypothetical protein
MPQFMVFSELSGTFSRVRQERVAGFLYVSDIPKFVNSRVVSLYLHLVGLLSLVSWQPPSLPRQIGGSPEGRQEAHTARHH